MTTATTAHRPEDRIAGIIARQRSSRARDLVFAALLAIGFGLSLGALRNAAARAAAPVAAISAIDHAG